jgi:hypothetical protein
MPRVRAPLPPAPRARLKSRLSARASACALQWRSKDEPARGCRRTSARATPTARAAAAQCSPQCCRCPALTVRGRERPAAAQPEETGKCQRRGTCCLSLKRHTGNRRPQNTAPSAATWARRTRAWTSQLWEEAGDAEAGVRARAVETTTWPRCQRDTCRAASHCRGAAAQRGARHAPRVVMRGCRRRRRRSGPWSPGPAWQNHQTRQAGCCPAA